jgi:hypothetical protein
MGNEVLKKWILLLVIGVFMTQVVMVKGFTFPLPVGGSGETGKNTTLDSFLVLYDESE